MVVSTQEPLKARHLGKGVILKLRDIILGVFVGTVLFVSPAVTYAVERDTGVPVAIEDEGSDEIALLGSSLGADERIVGDIVRAAEVLSHRVDFDYSPAVSEVRRAINWVGEHRGDLLLNTDMCVSWGNDGKAKYVELQYLGSIEDVPRKRQDIERAIEEALSWVSPASGEAERAKALHDYIIRNCSYDYSNYVNETIPDESYNAFGVLCLSKGVCLGYSRAYSTLLYYAGIESLTVSSDLMDHAWTVLNIDGSWYHCDITFDDPVSFQTGLDGGFSDVVDDSNFLKSDVAIKDHYGWESPVSCASSRFDDVKWESYDRPYALMRFRDVDPEAWYIDSLAWAVEEGVLNGSGQDVRPDAPMTRAEVAAMMWNAFGDGAVSAVPAPMSDVSQSQWYSNAINWAVESEIINGYGSGSFGTGDAITREQFCVIVERLADDGVIYPIRYDERYLALKDKASISAWARYAVLVEFSMQIINGNGGYLRPQDALTRSEAVAILKNAVGKGFIEI